MDARRAAPRDVQGPAHDGIHPHPVDVVDGKDRHPGLLHPPALPRVDVPPADLDAFFHRDEHRLAPKVHHAPGPIAAHGGKGHPVHIPREGGLVAVPVPVGVDPDEAQGPGGKMPGRGGNAPRGNAVVTSQNDGEMSRRQALAYRGKEAAGALHHLVPVAQVGEAGTRGRREDVSPVLHRIAQAFQPLLQSAQADGLGPHGHPPAGSSHIHLDADDLQGPIHCLLAPFCPGRGRGKFTISFHFILFYASDA